MTILNEIDISNSIKVQAMINRYQQIINQSDFKGERDNAQSLMDKLITKAKAAGTFNKDVKSKFAASAGISISEIIHAAQSGKFIYAMVLNMDDVGYQVIKQDGSKFYELFSGPRKEAFKIYKELI